MLIWLKSLVSGYDMLYSDASATMPKLPIATAKLAADLGVCVCVCVVWFVRVRALMRVRVLMNPEFSFIRTYYHTTPIPTPTLATTPMHLWASSKTERLARLLKARGAATAVQMTPAMSMFMMLCM